MKYVLVTGGCGRVGNRLCEELIKKGNTVIAIDDTLSEYNTKKSDFVFISTKDGIKSALEQAFNKYAIENVVHLGCTADNDIGPIITDDDLKKSQEYDNILFKMASENSVSHFVLVSTNQVYAKVKTREPISEFNGLLKPITNYGKLKLNSEKSLSAISKVNKDMIIAILRVPQLYSLDFYDNLLSKIEDTKTGANFIYRQGDYGFHFCCIDNLIDFIIGYLRQAEDTSFTDIFNIADNDLITASDIIKFMKENYKLGVVLQRPEPKDNPIKAITSKIVSTEEKTNYRYLDYNTILNCLMLDTTKAKKLCPFRWNIKNIK